MPNIMIKEKFWYLCQYWKLVRNNANSTMLPVYCLRKKFNKMVDIVKYLASRYCVNSISFNQMQPCLKITSGSYNILIKNEHFITNWRLMINTRLFATVLERLLLFPFKTALWLRMILSRLLKVNSKTQQINYSTVLPGFDLVQMADDCDEYILTKNRLSYFPMNFPWSVRPQGEGGFIWSHRFFSPCSFIY